MELMERASNARDMLRRKHLEDKLDDVSRESERLRIENRALKDEARRDRSELERLLDLLERRGDSDHGRTHRLRALMLLTASAGAAYVMGAKAGRARYEEILDRWHRIRATGTERLVDVRDEMMSAAKDRPEDEAASSVSRRSVAGSVRA